MASFITTQAYTAVGLSMGTSYTFKVLARNAYGQSVYSTELIVLAAQIPDKPIPPVTSIAGPNVHITWQAPTNGGSQITAYKVYFS